jgi:hypothetical protein
MLIGRASVAVSSLISIEAHRRAHFLPVVNVVGGNRIHSSVVNEDYIVIATYPEIIGSLVSSLAARLLVSNGTLTVKRDVKTADEYGNVTTTQTDIVTGRKAYIESTREGLKQYNPGLNPDAEFVIFVGSFTVDLLDKVTIISGGVTTKLKVISANYSDFEGVVWIQAKTETRN